MKPITHYRKLSSLLLFSMLAVPLEPDAQVPVGFGQVPTFHEEFDGSHYDAKVWILRGAGTRRDACMIDSRAVSVSKGFARIRIYSTYDEHKQPTNYCGALSSEKSFLKVYGYWEAGVRFRYKPGMQSSFWIQSPKIHTVSAKPAESGVEMDVFEHISGAPSGRTYDHAVHWNGYVPGVGKSLAFNGTANNLNDGKFHRFGVAWSPQNLTFYVDGAVTWSLSASEAVISEAEEFIVLDTEIQNASYVPRGGYGALGSRKNAYFDVDYVRVYPYLLSK